jgi:predicted nucleic acid-binding protein
LKQLRDFLKRHRRIALDTSIFIYELEANPRYAEFTDAIFAWIEQSGHSAVTSTITMTELLVQPYRDSGEDRVNLFYGLLTTYPRLEWIAPDLEIADTGARFRTLYRMRTPDALQAATAVHSRATGLMANDSVFARVDAFETFLLDDLIGH